MAIDAVVILESLSCLQLKNVETRTEPYIWPALIRVDDNTLNTESGVAVTGPFLGDARVVIKDSMRTGETVSIPSSVGTLRTRFEDNLLHRFLILVVFPLLFLPQDALFLLLALEQQPFLLLQLALTVLLILEFFLPAFFVFLPPLLLALFLNPALLLLPEFALLNKLEIQRQDGEISTTGTPGRFVSG